MLARKVRERKRQGGASEMVSYGETGASHGVASGDGTEAEKQG